MGQGQGGGRSPSSPVTPRRAGHTVGRPSAPFPAHIHPVLWGPEPRPSLRLQASSLCCGGSRGAVESRGVAGMCRAPGRVQGHLRTQSRPQQPPRPPSSVRDSRALQLAVAPEALQRGQTDGRTQPTLARGSRSGLAAAAIARLRAQALPRRLTKATLPRARGTSVWGVGPAVTGTGEQRWWGEAGGGVVSETL